MNDRELIILHQLAHPASARAVAIDGTRWRQDSHVLELLDWGEICFSLWKNGIAVPGPTIDQISYWWVHDAWRSQKTMFDALHNVVGQGWVEGVQHRIFRDVVLGFQPRQNERGSIQRVFLLPASCCGETGIISSQLRDIDNLVKVGWTSWTDQDLMGEDDYSSGVIEALATLDQIMMRLTEAPRLLTRGQVIKSVLDVVGRCPSSNPVRHRAEAVIEEAHEILDRAIEEDVEVLLTIRSTVAETLVNLERANAMVGTMHSGPRQISLLGKICESERLAKTRQSEVQKRLEAPKNQARLDGGR